MKKRVLHITRRATELKATFIKIQYENHIEYEALAAFRINDLSTDDGRFPELQLKNENLLNLSENETLKEKIFYKLFKIISNRQVKMLSDFINKNDIRLCHFHFGSDCGVFYPFTKHLPVPAVVSYYGYDTSSFPKMLSGYGAKYLQNRVFKHVNLSLAMSPDMQTDLEKAGCPAGKIKVHYYGIETEKFFMQRQYNTQNKINILIIASLVPQKGHEFLLKAIQLLKNENSCHFELRIVGGGELENHLKNLVKKLHLQDVVIFPGVVRYGSQSMMDELKNADIFVHPSVTAPNGDKEGIPGTIVEAMAAGLPVVSTFHAGIPFIIEPGKSGELVKEYDYHGLKNALSNLIASKDLREKYGKAGQEFVMQNLNHKRKIIQLENTYDNLINNIQ